MAYYDSHWHGAPADVTAALTALGWTADGSGAPQYAGLLPTRTLDGITYVAVRATTALTLPAGLTETGPDLSAAVLGVWA